jgi:hypothetical protein
VTDDSWLALLNAPPVDGDRAYDSLQTTEVVRIAGDWVTTAGSIAARGYASGPVDLPGGAGGVANPVAIDTITFKTNSVVGISENGGSLAPLAGIYQVNAQVVVTHTDPNLQIVIYQNGEAVSSGQITSNDLSVQVSDLVPCDASDEITMQVVTTTDHATDAVGSQYNYLLIGAL